MRFPGPAGRFALAAATAVWVGALVGLSFGVVPASAAAAAAAGAWLVRRPSAAVLLALVGAGVLSGWLAAERIESTWNAEIPEGSLALIGLVAEDGKGNRSGVLKPDAILQDGVAVPWAGPPIGVDLTEGLEVIAGERVLIQGPLRRAPGRVRGDPIAGWIAAQRIETVGGAGPLFVVGNAVRARVEAMTAGDAAGRALLAGFLIGDTSQMSARDLDALRRSGLTHFVAVSGSNVALFLAGWWVITAPFGLGSRRRFALGLLGLAVFVVVTRWEASVLRAATMAGLILGGAAAGVVVDGWMALGAAVAVLLLVSGQLAVNIGFQLSVAAAAGIMLGAGLAGHRKPRWAWTVLAAAASAQIAVLPILLWHFGTIPLLAPVANLLSAPLVSAATISGALGVVTGWRVLVDLGSLLAGMVLIVARLAATWPQLGVGSVLVVGAFGLLALHRRLRPALAVLAALALAAVTLSTGLAPSGAIVTFLDVGQGDAVLIRSQGMVALVDGGGDPAILADRLRSHGVGRIDLLVVTHGDSDHVGGLEGILVDHGVGRLWVPAYGDPGAALAELVAEALGEGVVVERVDARSPPYLVGAITLRPIGPMRRYAADNDGSIVIWAEAERSMLLAGDIEAIAQTELPVVRPDFLLVPHHGSASTDGQWLEVTVGETAVVSVGENRFGHPSPEIMTILEQSGAEILVTAEEGDVTVKLD